MAYLKLVHSGSSSGPNTANIILYPNKSGYDDDVCDGSIAAAVDTGFDGLTDNDLLGEYNVYKYVTSNYPAFDNSSTSYSELGSEWIDWLDNNSDYWPSKNGCHMLVASDYKDSGGPAGTDYNRENFDIEKKSNCGFNTSQAMLLGLYNAHTYKEKHENFAIQEPLHTFIPEDYIKNNTSLFDPDDPEEHQLGYVTSAGNATPMLTGHAGSDDWYHNEEGLGQCKTDWKWEEGHIKILTSCTQEAMYKTANNA